MDGGPTMTLAGVPFVLLQYLYEIGSMVPLHSPYGILVISLTVVVLILLALGLSIYKDF